MKLLGWIVAVPVAAVVLLIVARLMLCKPDREVVKVATPMVEKIAEYIVQNGVPDSLESVPNLPYRLKGCHKEIVYWTLKRPRKIVHSKKEAGYAVVKETCHFDKKNIFNVTLVYTDESGKISGDLDISSGKTSVGTSFESKDGKLEAVGIGANLDKRTGFCRSLKQ